MEGARDVIFPVLLFLTGRADDPLRSCRGSRGVPRQEHVSQKGLQGKNVMRDPKFLGSRIIFRHRPYYLCHNCLTACRSSSISAETLRKGILCPPELLLEFLLPSELLLVRCWCTLDLIYQTGYKHLFVNCLQEHLHKKCCTVFMKIWMVPKSVCVNYFNLHLGTPRSVNLSWWGSTCIIGDEFLFSLFIFKKNFQHCRV